MPRGYMRQLLPVYNQIKFMKTTTPKKLHLVMKCYTGLEVGVNKTPNFPGWAH